MDHQTNLSSSTDEAAGGGAGDAPLPPGKSAAKRACKRPTCGGRDMMNFARCYIVNQLRRENFEALADELSDFEDPCDQSHLLLQTLAEHLSEERREQFEDMCYNLEVNRQNIEDIYRTIMDHLFLDDINWGRIVTFLAFSGVLAVYCAQNDMVDLVEEVIELSEQTVHSRLQGWIRSQGGWKSVIHHFDIATLSRFFVPIAVVVVLIAGIVGGLLFFKKQLK